MSKSKTLNLEIELECDVLTTGTLAEITNSILEFLLYQRNQIEFVYKTYNVFVNELKTSASEAESVVQYRMGRQREKAIETKESISAMRKLIQNAFKKRNIKCLRFLFGSTTFTPKEVYTVHMPTNGVSDAHLHDHHRFSQMRLNQLLISLITKQDLYAIFSNNLCPTNIYLELELMEETGSANSNTLSQVFPKEIGRLPSSCKNVNFFLRHKPLLEQMEPVLNCCKELTVFEDIMQPKRTQEVEDTHPVELNEFISSSWWESEIIVRGFKEQIVKGNSIWTK